MNKRNEKLLLFGRWSSKIGDVIFDYTNSIIIVSTFANSSWILSLYQSAQTIVNILFNIIGGVISDLGKRKRIIIIADLLSAFVCFITSILIESDYLATILVCANAILAIIFSFSSPAFKAIVRDMIDRERIGVYNSISNAGIEIINVLGPALGVVLLKYVSAKEALLINSATFLISAIAELFLVSINDSSLNRKKKESVISSIKLGIQYLMKEKRILYLVVLSAFVNFFLAGYNLLGPYTENIYQGIFQNFYSKVIIVEALGGIIGSVINTKVISKMKNDFHTMILFLGFTGISLIIEPVLSLTSNLVLCLVPFFMFGAFLTMFNISFMTYVQVTVEDSFLGRVFSVIFTVAVLFMPIGSFVFSFLHLTKTIWGFLPVGTGIVVLSLISFLFMNKYLSK